MTRQRIRLALSVAATLASVTALLALIVLVLTGSARGAVRQVAGTDPPICRLVPMTVQTRTGGQATAWFRWCGMGPDAPSPVKLWVTSFTGDGFTFAAWQCPKASPCTVYGTP